MTVAQHVPVPSALPSRVLRIAAAQAPVLPGDVEANAARAAELVDLAAAAGARLVVFAEKFLTGYDPELIATDPVRYTVTADDPRLAPIAAACRTHAVTAVLGAATRDEAGVLRISALVLGPDGAPLARYDKQHQYGMEPAVFAAGSAGLTLVLDGWRLGLGICYDSGFPEHARAAALDGCHAYLVGALFGTGVGRRQRAVWFPARAMDNTMYVLLANHVGSAGDLQGCGGSAVWGPDAALLADAGGTDAGLAVADLEPSVLAAVRAELTMVPDLAARDAAIATGPRTRVTVA
ncbi:carbon-nitrogen hydrolase family protein [Streptomyces tateyamensis]|uniref:Carbon-nitrogen hydrolase family protein n=1 Tax=Streptomyces tateyamensis TaxID=565073 RepID=A0A2V4PCD6_9ACTN|nr:carbon-nitrogen hydrolase family protein [Streptomyces tateyamensis]PYC82663.1 carbon-nitrogen hydrolase family protein [Streptomyces tateyamensis]